MIADAIKQARVLARKAQEATYDGVCTVMEYQKAKDPKTRVTSKKTVVVLKNEPCRLSYSNVSAVDQTETVAKTTQSIRLFLSPDISIKAGCTIEVTQSGITRKYKSSGVPAVYATHQEIVLELAERYA